MKNLIAAEAASDTAKTEQFVTFTLEDELYGVPVIRVQEIIGYQSLTHIPNTPAFVKGVLNLRGSVVPVLDLREKFHMAYREYDSFTVILILEIHNRTIGFIVDTVSDVIDLPESCVEPTPDFSSGVRADFISGMGRDSGRLILLLDLDNILSGNGLDATDIVA